MSQPSSSQRVFHGPVYSALIPLIMVRFADTPFSVRQLLNAVGPKLMVPVEGEVGVSRPVDFSPEDALDRLSYLTSLAVYAARPRNRKTLAHRDAKLARFVTEGAFYRTEEGLFVWDTNARWWWDERTGDARLWNNVLPHDPTVTVRTIAATGFSPRSDGKHQGVQSTPIQPLSKLPPGTPLPPPLTKPTAAPEPPPEAPEQPAEAEAPPVPSRVTREVVVAPEVPELELLSNDGHPGGTLVLKVAGQVIVASIKAVA